MMRVDIWSDLVCPWCYIGKRRFERAMAGSELREDVQVVYRSFQLNPAAPRDRTSDRARYVRDKYRLSQAELEALETRLVHTAEEEGLEFRLEGQLTGNTLDAHRLLQFAGERSVQERLVERLFRAYFVERRSLFDLGSLEMLAIDAGLEAKDVQEVLGSNLYADAVAADAALAHSLRVRGVPFYLFDQRHALSGAQPASVFRQALSATPPVTLYR